MYTSTTLNVFKKIQQPAFHSEKQWHIYATKRYTRYIKSTKDTRIFP